MQQCVLCHRDTGEQSALALCASCRGQICALRPQEGRYLWYVRALSRARSQEQNKSPAVLAGSFLRGTVRQKAGDF